MHIYAVLIVSKVPNMTANFKILRHNSKCDCKMLNIVVIIRNVTAKCCKL